VTKGEFEKRMLEIGQDTLSDNPGMDIQDCAVDLADCALYDPEILKFCKKEWPGESREGLKYIVADYIAG
jgi:hypothetical protein